MKSYTLMHYRLRKREPLSSYLFVYLFQQDIIRISVYLFQQHKTVCKLSVHIIIIIIIIITIFIWHPSWSSDHSRRALAHVDFFTLTVTFEQRTNIVAD